MKNIWTQVLLPMIDRMETMGASRPGERTHEKPREEGRIGETIWERLPSTKSRSSALWLDDAPRGED